MATATLPVDELVQLAKESLRLFSELQRSGVPVSPTTTHALLNEVSLAIEAIRTTLPPPEVPSQTLARLAPWAEIVIPAVAPVAAVVPAEAPAKRHRRTKAEMEADAAAEAAKKAAPVLPPLPLVEDRTLEQQVADGDRPTVEIAAFVASEEPFAVTNPMPIDATAVIASQASTGIPVTVEESKQPGFDRDKAEAVLKQTGDAFRAAEKARLEREIAASLPNEPSSGSPYAMWKEKLHLAPQPEDMALPFKNGDYANKKFSECSLRDLEVVLANYVRGVEGDPDAESRAKKSLWLERGAAWHRYRFDLLLINAGELDMEELRADYKKKADAPSASPSMQLHRRLWHERLEEVSRVRKEHGA